MAFKHPIWFSTDRAANFGCYRFRITPDIAPKLLRARPRRNLKSYAVRLKSEQTPFPRRGRRLRSAALHRIRFGTCGFVPMWYFYSEANNDRKIEQKQCALLWLATISRQFRRKLHEKKLTRRGQISTKHENLVDSRTESVSQEWKQVFLKRACQQRLQPTRKRFVFFLACPNRRSCAWAWSQGLGHRICSQILRLSSGIAFESDCQMSCMGSNSNQTWTLPPDQSVVEVLSAPKHDNMVQ